MAHTFEANERVGAVEDQLPSEEEIIVIDPDQELEILEARRRETKEAVAVASQPSNAKRKRVT